MTQLVNLKKSSTLSQVQQAIWFLHHLEPKGLTDKNFWTVIIKSPVDVETVKTVFQTLINRHSSLRSIYRDEGQLIQETSETAEVDFQEIDASHWSWDELNEKILLEAKRPFNLEKGCLLRVRLFSRSANEHILLVTVHQMGSDWESLLILVDEFFRSYNSDRLPPLTQSYQDWVQQELDLLESPEGKKLEKYWKNRLAGELPVLELPGYSSGPVLRTYNGSSPRFAVNGKLTQQLRELAQREEVPLDNILLAAFKVLLYRYTGDSDILVGVLTPRKPKFEGVVGNFLNAAVVVSEGISSAIAFKEFLTQVNKTVLEVRNYQDYPFPLLVSLLQSGVNSSHSPICQVSFKFHNLYHLANLSNLFESAIAQKPIRCGELELEYFELPQQKVDFDFNLEVMELKDSLLGYFKYNSNLLDSETVAQISGHFQNLLEEIAANPEQLIGELRLLSEREREKLLVEWNATETKYDFSLCLHQLIEAQVEKTQDAIALEFENERLTYRELNCRANQLARYLQKLGVKPEVLVGICVERSIEMVVGLLGILKAGGAYVPIDPEYPPERLAYMLEDSSVEVLLTQGKLLDKLSADNVRPICLDKDWEEIARESQENAVSGVEPDNLAYVIYTSGSTGKPKGAANSHRGICNRLLWMQDAYKLTKSDRVLQKTPFSFDVSVWEFFWTLLTGARLVIAKPGGHQDSAYLVNIIAREKITTVHFVPSMLQVFLEEKGLESCSSLKRVICSGEALPFELQERFFARMGCELHNLYGPTEAAIDVTFWQCQRESNLRTVPIGRPVANTQLYILDPYLQLVPIGVSGELHIGGVQVARGYLNRPELTAEKFIHNPFDQSKLNRLYKTGDLARYLPDGNIEYLGRIDNQVKIRGFRIELGEIEAVLSQHAQVRETTVIARSEKSGEKRLVAYVVPTQEKPTPSSLRRFLKQKLPEYAIPAAFVVLEFLPLTPSGKVNRRALPAPDLSSFIGENQFISPRDEVERQLAQIWSEVLNINPVGVKDNFFELGGHSLLALNLMAKIQQQFGNNLPLATLFGSPTIEDLANELRSPTAVSSYSPLVTIQRKGTKSPFFCVHPAGGHVLCYVNLSRYLGAEQPFYGLQARGFNEGEEALMRIEDMASLYVKAIREFKPEGPYQIGGWSFGGVVAYEVAQQLHQQGQEVSLLAVLDSYVPILLDGTKKIDDVYLVGVLSRVYGGMFGLDNLVDPEELQGLSVQEQIEYIINKAREVGVFSQDSQYQQNRRILDVMVGTLKATYAYKRQPYPGKVTVFRAQEKHIMAPDPKLVWVELFSILDAGDIEIVKVPGNHYSFVLEPHVKVLAERLGACLT